MQLDPAVERRDAVLQAAQPGARRDVGAAGAVVRDLDRDAVWISGAIVLYFPCRWFAGVKATRREWWLSYI